jgi:hypothetical protein
MWQYQEMPPARGVISPRAMAQTVIRAGNRDALVF